MDRRNPFPPNDAAGSRPSLCSAGFPTELRARSDENDSSMEESKIHRTAGNRRLRHSSATLASPSLGSVVSAPRHRALLCAIYLRLSIPDAKRAGALLRLSLVIIRSGRRESNPVYIHPMDAYYRHTPARSSQLYRMRAKIASVRKRARSSSGRARHSH